MQNDRATASTDTRRQEGRLGALGNPFFRLYWLSMLASFLATQIQSVAQSWLVLELTNSALWLGLTGGAVGLPVLVFSLFGGAIADRVERRRLMIMCQGAMACLKVALTLLVLTGQVQVWHVIAASMGLGLIMAFNDPARQAFVTELVKKEELLNAVSLTATATNITRVGGPMVAGALIGAFGLGVTYLLNTVISVTAAVTLWPIRKSSIGAEARRSTVWSNVVEGLSFVRGNRTVLWLLVFAGFPTIFGPVSIVLAPIFARDVLDVGAIGLGQLMAATGLGALIGSVAIAGAGDLRHKGILFAVSGMVHNLASLAFAFSTSFPLSLAALAVQGFASAGWMATVQTLIQINTPNELRGRVMSLYLVAMQSVFLAQVIGGATASLIGAPYTTALASVIAFLMNLSMLVVTPVIRRLD